MAYFSKDFIQFFKDLAGNNNKEWFDENRKRYEREVKDPFKKFVQDVIDMVSKHDPKVGIEPKDAIFRINRDIRFSKDKTPYKTNVSAIVSPIGKKDKTNPGLYFELTPEHVRIYGGVYMTDKEQLYSVRSHIVENLKEFEKIISDKKFVDVYGEVRGEKNKVIPSEFKEAAEKQPLIFNKQFYYFTQFEPELVLKDDLLNTFEDAYKVSLPIADFLSKALQS
jgi:uncharacterized protein (TIGR02453 family)